MPRGALIPKIWEVPQIFRDRLGAEAGRQRAMFAEGHLLMILHEVPTSTDLERHGELFWRSAEGKWRSTAQGSGIGGLKKHFENYKKRMGLLEKREAKAERAKEYFDIITELTPLHRATRHMYKVLQQAREMVKQDHELITCRDEAGDLDREIELFFSDTRYALEYYMARQTEKQAVQAHQMAMASHRLNVLAAIFFPLATLASLLGMNIRSGLEDSKPPGMFLLILLGGLAIGFFLKSAYMNRPITVDGDSNKEE